MQTIKRELSTQNENTSQKYHKKNMKNSPNRRVLMQEYFFKVNFQHFLKMIVKSNKRKFICAKITVKMKSVDVGVTFISSR